MSNDRCGVFTVHIPNREVEFIKHPRGLHYLDLNKPSNAQIRMATTINENIEGYTKQAVDGTIKAQHLQGMMGHPSQHDFANLVCDQLVQNCPITTNDVTNAYNIFGPDLAGSRGKMVRKKQLTYTQITWKYQGGSLKRINWSY